MPAPRIAALLAAAVVAATTLLTAPAQAAAPERAAARCPKGTVPWVVQGHRVCMPRPTAPPTGDLAAGTVAQWVTSISARQPGSTWKPPAALRKATPHAASIAADVTTLAVEAIATYADEHPLPGGTSARSAGPILMHTEFMEGPSLTTPEGATLTSAATIRVYDDRSHDIDVTVTATAGEMSLRWSPALDGVTDSWRKVGCPTAAGRVTHTERMVTGGTATVLKGRTVVKSLTQRTRMTATAVGTVGRDARLHEVLSSTRITIEKYERGLQFAATIEADFTAERDAVPTMKGSPTVVVKGKAIGYTAAEEAAYERETAQNLASNPGTAEGTATLAAVTAADLVSAEPVWYDLPNRCAEIDFDPSPGARLAHGARRTVTAEVRKVGGGPAESHVTVVSVRRGALTATKPDGDPGSPARLAAVGADYDDDTTTVGAELVATSRAGRAASGWYAESDPVTLPLAFDGTLSATTTTPGQHRWEFSGTARYTRTSLSVSPDGFVSAWYELTEASLAEVTEELGLVGCRWVGRGSGGTIEAGDLEIRRTPDGATTYALMYDVQVANADFVPTDCPPGTLQPFTGDITAYLNSHQVRAPLRPMPADFVVEVGGASDVLGAAGQPTVASWSLRPAGLG